MVLTHGIPPVFCYGVHTYRQPTTCQSRVYRVTQIRTDGVHCRESIGTGPEVLEVVPVMGAAFLGLTMNQFCMCYFFPTYTVGILLEVYIVDMCDTELSEAVDI